jgi:putative hydrolase of the HAD superfamily
MPFDWIAFDADDTLWHNEKFYQAAQQAFAARLGPYGVTPEAALAALHQTEIANLATLGYGIKGFLVSMLETAIQVTEGRISAVELQTIIDLGRAMLTHEVTLLEGSAAAVAALAATYPLMLITKGDLMDQERKINASGLAPYFRQIEIVSEKTAEVYAGLLRKHQIEAGRFLMVGNSLRSDILPVLELGGAAVYVPSALGWAYEGGELPTGVDGRFGELAHLGLLPAWVAAHA